MDVIKAIRHIVDDAGVSYAEVSRRMGRAHKFVDTYLARRTDPSLSVAAELAHACGWHLVLERQDGSERIDLEPGNDNER
ncbi:hypothetical protein [Olegusella massiliensis]|uniref:hypothetical protein n=1 Tax=Olegusella massiliensis TaxID=1776381 RepID=UPI0023F968B0|nr:hypothetical protein [Olegusella massiliensis]